MVSPEHIKQFRFAIAVSVSVHVLLFGFATGLFRFGGETHRMPVGVEVGIAKLGGGGSRKKAESAKPTTRKQAQPALPKTKVEKKKAPATKKLATVPPQARQDATARKDTVSLKPKKANTPQKSAVEPQPVAKTQAESVDTEKQDVLSGLDSLLKKHRTDTVDRGTGAGSGQDGGSGASKGSGQAALSGIAGNIYLGTLTQKISSYWDTPSGLDSSGLFTRVEIRISRNGVLEKAELVQSSGSELFDASALAALRAAAPFDAVPSTMQAPLEFVIRLVPPEDM